MLECNNDDEEEVMAVKRGLDGQDISKQPIEGGVSPITDIVNPGPIVIIKTNVEVSRLCATTRNKFKMKITTRKKNVSSYSTKDDVVTESENEFSGITIGKLLRGDEEETKIEIKRLISGRFCLNIKTAHENEPCRRYDNGRRMLKVAELKESGQVAFKLLDSGAIPELRHLKLSKIYPSSNKKRRVS